MMQSFRNRVINLYKQLLWAGKDYPGGIDVVRVRAKNQFMEKRNETDPKKIEEAIKKGEYILGELQSLNAFHKYRTLKKRYDSEMNEDLANIIGGEIREIDKKISSSM